MHLGRPGGPSRTVSALTAAPGTDVAPVPPVPAAPARPKPARVVSARVSLRRRAVELWHARELFVFLVRKELKVKYKNSFLGFLWSMLNPAFVLGIYYVVFKYFLKNPTPYFALYLFAGLLAWNLFNNSLMGASSAVVGNAGIVKKVAFPREILALSQVGTAISFFFFQLVVLVAFLAGFQYQPAWGYLPVLLLAFVCLVVFAAALAVFLSAANVYLRDIEHLIQVVLMGWFFAPPIVYTFPNVQEKLARHHLLWLYLANPLAPIVLAFERCIYGRVVTQGIQVLPTYGYDWYLVALGAVLVGSLGLLVLAMLLFGRLEGNFAEEL